MNTKEYFLRTWKSEVKTTINALKALPTSGLDYRPHSKTRSAQELVEHIVPHAEQIIEAVEKGVINYIPSVKYSSTDEAISTLEKQTSILEKALNSVDEKTWDEKEVPMSLHGNTIATGKMRDMCYTFLFDIIHHRGQLSTYFRLMGAKNPSIYGPTAEMMEEMAAQ